jgi:hypothetical protein
MSMSVFDPISPANDGDLDRCIGTRSHNGSFWWLRLPSTASSWLDCHNLIDITWQDRPQTIWAFADSGVATLLPLVATVRFAVSSKLIRDEKLLLYMQHVNGVLNFVVYFLYKSQIHLDGIFSCLLTVFPNLLDFSWCFRISKYYIFNIHDLIFICSTTVNSRPVISACWLSNETFVRWLD